jgi:hypothetical protein
MLWSLLSKRHRLRRLERDAILLKLVEHGDISPFGILLLLIHHPKLSEHLVLSWDARCYLLLFIHYLFRIGN